MQQCHNNATTKAIKYNRNNYLSTEIIYSFPTAAP